MTAKRPPPEREIALSLRVLGEAEIFSVSLEGLFGVATEILNDMIRMPVLQNLTGIAKRIQTENPALPHYGIKFSIFAPCDDDTCWEIFSFFADWTANLSRSLGVGVTFDIAQNEEQLEVNLESELRRMAHGDVSSQFAANVA